MTNSKIMLYEILGKSDAQTEATGMDKPEIVKEKLKTALEGAGQVQIDLSNMRSLSPSFAYEAFGKLYDIFGEDLAHRLTFTNDARDLQNRIKAALDRRREVLKIQA